MVKQVLILTEASSTLGLGHYYRAKNLADLVENNGNKIKWLIRGGQQITSLPSSNVEFVEWETPQTLQVIAEADLVVVDTYTVSQKFLNTIAEHAKKTVFIIDSSLNYGTPHRGTKKETYVFFPSAYADPSIIKHKNIKFLGGKDYMLFKKELLPYYIANRGLDYPPKITKITINIGGFYNSNCLSAMLSCIDALFSGIEIVILGKNAKNQGFPSEKNTVTSLFLNPAAYAERITRSDLIISNGGQSLNEAIFLDKPIICLATAANQERNIDFWKNRNSINFIGEIDKDAFTKNLQKALVEMKAKENRLKYRPSVNRVHFNLKAKELLTEQLNL